MALAKGESSHKPKRGILPGRQFNAAGREREHPDLGGKHAKHTGSRLALVHSILTTPFTGIHSPE